MSLGPGTARFARDTLPATVRDAELCEDHAGPDCLSIPTVDHFSDARQTSRQVRRVPRSDKRLWRDLGQMRAVIGAVTGRD